MEELLSDQYVRNPWIRAHNLANHSNSIREGHIMSIKIGNRFELEIAYGYFFARLPWGPRRGVRQFTLDLGYGHGNFWDKGDPGRDY